MILGYYEQVRDASSQMLQAARSNDWDALVAGEERCAAIIGKLQACSDDVGRLDANAKKRTHEIIRAILANDAEIRDLTQPWLRQLESHLGASRMSRRIANTYRS